jgi:hypothetical protein
MTMRDIDEEISRSSAKLGCPAKIVAIDYVQLADGAGSRYERVSDACEAARRLAKKHHVVVILVSQVSRKQGDQNEVREVTLHDAKESGSFENSCSLLLGLWKTSRTTMRCRVLKNSRGLSGNTVEMAIRGGTYIIDPGEMTTRMDPKLWQPLHGKPWQAGSSSKARHSIILDDSR